MTTDTPADTASEGQRPVPSWPFWEPWCPQGHLQACCRLCGQARCHQCNDHACPGHAWDGREPAGGAAREGGAENDLPRTR